ncbi:MAG: hypothetical protein M3159_04540 [Actinomycetota bacterium]|nr:hypothetical protein [Actinomycetota bacterium]
MSVLSIILRMISPLWVIADAAEDDQLFVRLGSFLQKGWLGPFNERTLQKGPAYPAFLAVAHQTHLPYLFVIQVVHLAACGATAFAVWRLVRSKWIAFGIYVVLALDPAYFGYSAGRLLRDNWYSSVCLLLFALAALALPRPGPGASRGRSRWLAVGGVGLTSGFVLASYWLGRAEHPWMFPAIAVLLAGGVVARRRRLRMNPEPTPERTYWREWTAAAAPVVVGTVLAVTVLGAAIFTVSWRNERAYGAFITDDLSGGEFARLYEVWQSVHAGPARRFVPISKPQRLAVYEVSRAARELQPSLEGSLQSWIIPGCQQLKVCDDIAAGWIPFALRGATAAAGHIETEAAAQSYWGRVADQITGACASGLLACARPMPMMLPSPSRFSPREFASSMWAGIRYLAGYHVADTERPFSTGTGINWTLFHDNVNGLPSALPRYRADESSALPRVRNLKVLRWVYSVAMFVLVPAALVGFVFALALRPRGLRTLWILGAAAGLAALGRLLLLALIDSTSFLVSAQPNYELPGVSFLLIFTVVGVVLLMRAAPPRTRWLSTRRAQRQATSGTESTPRSDTPSPAAGTEAVGPPRSP